MVNLKPKLDQPKTKSCSFICTCCSEISKTAILFLNLSRKYGLLNLIVVIRGISSAVFPNFTVTVVYHSCMNLLFSGDGIQSRTSSLIHSSIRCSISSSSGEIVQSITF